MFELSNKHLYVALFWKLFWSYKRKWYLYLFFIVIPYVAVRYIGMDEGHTYYFNERITHPMTPAYILKSALMRTDIKYTPGGNNTKIIMETVKKKLKHSSVKSLKDEEEVENEILKEYKRREEKSDEKLTYGVIFHAVTKRNCEYTLRSTEGKDWGMGKQYPDVKSAGPMDAGEHYFRRNFIALQIAINSGYLDYLGFAEKNWSLQEFPYPKYVDRKGFDPFILTFIACGSLCPLLLNMVDKVADEKLSGARAMMLLNGVKLHLLYFYWGAFFLILLIIAIALMTLATFQTKLISDPMSLSFFIVVLIYAITSMTLIFALTSLLRATFAQLGFLLYQSVIIFIIFQKSFKTMSPPGILTALTPAGSLAQGIGMIAFYEKSGFTLQLKDAAKINKEGRFSPYLLIILAPLVPMVLLMLLSVYMEMVKPGEYGRAKPWYFILPESLTERLNRQNKTPAQFIRSPVVLVEEKMENEGEIRVQNLRKVFKKFTALNNFSIDFHKGQITALLGHNGAGKTTFLYIITGIISPTSGEIFYKEYDVLLNFNAFRESFGFCPQQDILINDLSVKEQVLFFGMVKKMSKVESMEFVNSFFTKLNMNEKQNALPKKLSGGMKRKLCLAIAVVNNPPILFMDEPSSGLDPESRRSLWDIILELRKDRTIVITTHFMEEADILGDRIAIMANGELRCIGSPIFLKKHYGFGHSISINYKNTPEETISFVNSYVKATHQVDLNMKQITFNVPMEETSNLSILFAELESLVDKNHISVNCSSMESVFLKVQEGEGITTEFDESDIEFVVKERSKNEGGAQFLQQICSLIHKRALSFKHGWFLYIFMLLVIPILITVFVMSMLNTLLEPYLAEDVPSILDLSLYSKTDVLINGSQHSMSKSFHSLVEKQGSSAVKTDKSVFDELMATGKNEIETFRHDYVIAGAFRNGSANLFYSSMAYHSAPIAVNLYYNSFLYPKSSISIKNYPYTFATEICGHALIMKFVNVWGLLAFVLVPCMTIFNHFPTKERKLGIKHLQYMAEMKPLTYWISNIMFDITLCIITIMTITLAIYIADTHNVYRDSDILLGFFLIFFVFSFSIILWGYIFSTIIKSFDLSSSIIIFAVCGSALVSLIIPTYIKKSESYMYWFNLITPFRAIISGIVCIERASSLRQMCKLCLNQDEETCKEIQEFLILKENFLKNIFWILTHSAILILLLILLEIKIFRYLKYLYTRRWYTETRKEMDEDVQLEKDAVHLYLAGNQWKKSDRAEKVDNSRKSVTKEATDHIVYTALVDSPPPTIVTSADSTAEASANVITTAPATSHTTPLSSPTLPTTAPVRSSSSYTTLPMPSAAPVASPTTAPVTSTTTAPVTSPTTAPVTSPTTAPVTSPTTAPVTSPTTAPVRSSSSSTTLPMPSAAPVTSPSPSRTLPTTAPVMTTPATSPTSPSSDSVIDEIPVIIADRLTKMYSSKFIAADQVTFAAMKGECFGLLGVSGAGKSTVFSMLSGRVYPTAGNAYIIEHYKRYKLKIIGYDFINKMGYCPQEYWIYDQLTARQLMTHFANLRGVKRSSIKDNISWWIKILDLHNYCDKPCGTYSGGNKRKLSTALALIGKPIIILLDEPTTGVDPVTRRKLWQVFKLVKNTDQTMILSSHSMDECEAVCNRLTIMAKGSMRCIGEINYLKNKHAQGCTILIKFDIDSPPETTNEILRSMMSNFGEKCVLTDQQKGILHFHLKEKPIKWSFVFSEMEKLKKKFDVIEEYMLSATSLEQIFLSFANK